MAKKYIDPTKAPRGRRRPYEDYEIVDALYVCNGNRKATAQFLGMSESGLRGRIKNSIFIQQNLEYMLSSIGNFVEDKLLEKIDEGDTRAIIFYAKTKLKDRGYVEKQEVEHSGEVEIRYKPPTPIGEKG